MTVAVLGVLLNTDDKAVADKYQSCIARKQYDHEAFDISKQAIKLNINDYSAWWLRRRCIEIDPTLCKVNELERARSWIADSPKNYQAWYHRRWLMERIERPEEHFADEFTDLNDVADEDPKNHNQWQYRQWFVAHFSLPLEPEYEMIEDLIIADSNNNSAWNYREWLCARTDPTLRQGVIKREIKYATKWLERNENEAVVNYLLGMFQDPITLEADSRPSLATAHPKLKETLVKLVSGPNPTRSHLVVAALAQVEWAEGNYKEAKKLYSSLLTMAPLQAGLYKWRLQALENFMASSSSSQSTS